MSSYDREFLLLPGNFFLWQDMSSCDRVCLPVTGNLFQWQEILSCEGKDHPLTGSFFLWQANSSCDRKFLPVTGSFFLWQEIFFCHSKFLPERGNFFLWHIVSYSKFLSRAGYYWHFSSFWYKIATKMRGVKVYLKIVMKVGDFCSKHRLRVQGFLPIFSAPWPLKSHPGSTCQRDLNLAKIKEINRNKHICFLNEAIKKDAIEYF